MLRWIRFLLVAIVGCLLPFTTTASAATFAYGASAVARVDDHAFGAADAGTIQVSGPWEGSVSPSATGRGTFTTPSISVVATKFDGEFVYRVHGGDSGPWGHSWTTENPLQMANPRDTLGLPKVNSGEYVTCARVCNTDGVIRREALPLDGTTGGGPELLFPDPVRQLEHVWTVRPGTPL
jgi:hypothetical protein